MMRSIELSTRMVTMMRRRTSKSMRCPEGGVQGRFKVGARSVQDVRGKMLPFVHLYHHQHMPRAKHSFTCRVIRWPLHTMHMPMSCARCMSHSRVLYKYKHSVVRVQYQPSVRMWHPRRHRRHHHDAPHGPNTRQPA
jgi:hypothetical protein